MADDKKADETRHTSALEILLTGALSVVAGRLIGRNILGEERIRRAERIDARADELAEKRKGNRREEEALPRFEEMLDARHKGLLSLTIPDTRADT